MSLDAAEDTLVERWVSRYRVANPVQAWKQADPTKTQELAFRAIASDQALLLGLDWSDAHDMASDAEKMAAHFKQEATAAAPTMRLVSEAVLERINNWRSLRDRAKPAAAEPLARPRLMRPVAERPVEAFDRPAIPQEYRDIFGAAFDDYPAFSEKGAAAIAATVLAIGPRDLARMKPPMDNIFAVMGARFAARCARGAYHERAMPRDECVGIIGVVQDWAARTNNTPLAVEYNGRVGTHAERARVLAYDAMACVELAADLPAGDAAAAASVAAWERAAEVHSYVAVALNINGLQWMDYDKIEKLAAAASRFARRAIEEPDTCKMPELPAFLEVPQPQQLLGRIRKIMPDLPDAVAGGHVFTPVAPPPKPAEPPPGPPPPPAKRAMNIKLPINRWRF